MENDLRSQRFKRVASRRTDKILEDVRKLGNCSNRIMYDYSEEELSKIFSAIEAEVDMVKKLFNTKGKSSKRFTL